MPCIHMISLLDINHIVNKLGCKKWKYHKIPKTSRGAYIFQRPFLRGLFSEGLIFGGAYVQREICLSKSIGLACSGKEIYHFCSRANSMYKSPGGLIFGGAI